MHAPEDRDNLIAALSKRLSNAEVRELPYPHFFIPDVFPQHWFDGIRAAMPENLSYASTDPRRTSNEAALQFRRRINLSESDIDFLPETSKATWDCVEQLLPVKSFFSVKQLLSDHLVGRYGTTDLETRTELNSSEIKRDT